MKIKTIILAVCAAALCLVSCKKNPTSDPLTPRNLAAEIVGYWVVESIQFFSGEQQVCEVAGEDIARWGFDEEPVVFTPEFYLIFSGEVPYSIEDNTVTVDVKSTEALSYLKELTYTMSREGKLIEKRVMRKGQEMELESIFYWDNAITTYVRGEAPATTLENLQGEWGSEWYSYYNGNDCVFDDNAMELARKYGLHSSNIIIDGDKMTFAVGNGQQYLLTIRDNKAYVELKKEDTEFVKQSYLVLSPFRQLTMYTSYKMACLVEDYSEKYPSFSYDSSVIYYIHVTYGADEEM